MSQFRLHPQFLEQSGVGRIITQLPLLFATMLLRPLPLVILHPLPLVTLLPLLFVILHPLLLVILHPLLLVIPRLLRILRLRATICLFIIPRLLPRLILCMLLDRRPPL